MTKKFRKNCGVETIDELGNVCRGLVVQELDEDSYLVYFFKRFLPPDRPELENPRIVKAEFLYDLIDNNFSVGDKVLINFQDTRPNRIGLGQEGELFDHFGEEATILEWYDPFGEILLIPEGKTIEDRYFANQPWLLVYNGEDE